MLILAGGWALVGEPASEIRADLSPFFAGGSLGLFQAMGFTFIALQGFDLIAAVAGEIREPERTIPRAMLLSLAIALAIYLPLLFVIATVGVPALSRENPETIVALAAANYLGPFGYWLVIAAAVLSMLSALEANLYAASRVALTMATDRTLPRGLSVLTKKRGAPAAAVLATAGVVAAILLIVPNVAAAGAASSLIFLLTFTLAHGINMLARRRRGRAAPFRVPWFPLAPVLGAAACFVLAVFQGVAVPSAGLIAGGWIMAGGALYVALFARSARVVDAGAEALDPEVTRPQPLGAGAGGESTQRRRHGGGRQRAGPA